MTEPRIAKHLSPLILGGVVVTCGAQQSEMMAVARTPARATKVRRDREFAYRWLPTEDEDSHRALDVQAELITRDGSTEVPFTTLLIAATAERHRVAIIHSDHVFDKIAAITGQRMFWADGRR
jgi:predicted nucleic acid-binding protein